MKETIRYQSQLLQRRVYKPMRIHQEGGRRRLLLVLRSVEGCGGKPRLELVPEHRGRDSG